MKNLILLVAEDDDSDALLLERALRRSAAELRMVRVTNGEEVIDYLQGRGSFQDRLAHPSPHLVLLDLKMPRKDGFSVLRWRQQSPDRAELPFIVFSSSTLKQDIEQAYRLGANSYVVKPDAPGRLEIMVKALQDWWNAFNVTTATTPVF